LLRIGGRGAAFGCAAAENPEDDVVVRCPGCQTGYRLDVTRVPDAGVRVRCPRCAEVFRLRPASPAVPPAPAAPVAESLPGIERDLREPPRLGRTRPERQAEPAAVAPPRPTQPNRPAWNAAPERTLDLGAAPKGPPPRLETPPFRPSVAAEPVATVAPPVPAAPAPPATAAHERARRLARVLVSDLLVYNQAVRDRARAEGTLATALGPQIGKAWDLYKSKVGPEVAGTTTYFKDALNEILAGGEKTF
jgi:predicted Zn finger-like uncharacterized protein